MNINPVIGMCRKVDALIRVQTDRVQTEDKPKKKSKGFVVRNIAEDTQPRNKDSKSTPLDYVVNIVKMLREMDTKEEKDDRTNI